MARIEELRRNENFSTTFKVILRDDETVEQQKGTQCNQELLTLGVTNPQFIETKLVFYS